MSSTRIRSLTAFFFCSLILSPGGCPVAQQPRTPPEEQQQQNSGSAQTGNTTETRPIPSVQIDSQNANTNSTSSGQTGNSNSSGGANDGFSFALLEPISTLSLRPGPAVAFRYTVSDPRGAARKVEFILATDDNADGVADGAPLYSRGVSTTGGTQDFVLDTADANLAAQLVNGFRRFKPGLRVEKVDGSEQFSFAGGGLVIDAVPPT